MLNLLLSFGRHFRRPWERGLFEHHLPSSKDGQSEYTIQTLEDMLLSYVLEFGGSWESHLPLVKFIYNNSYQTNIKMAPFALYGRRCRSLIGWFEVSEVKMVGPNLVQDTMEKVKVIRERLLVAQHRQKPMQIIDVMT